MSCPACYGAWLLESLFQSLQRFGVGRLTAIFGVAVGIAAILMAIVLNFASQPKALLYSNLDLKEASEISATLEAAGIKAEARGDGSTLFVKRDEVATARMMLATKGLPTAGSVGYEIFDNAPALGQTEFVQNTNRQRALEGELARTIRGLRGISSARVHLVMPERRVFNEQTAAPTASVVLGLAAGDLGADQVRGIRNLVAGAVPNLKPDNVTVLDDRNRLLAAGGEDDSLLNGAGAQRKGEIEDTMRRRVLDIVQGVVGPGAARVTVTADINQTATTREQIQYDPDGQVVRSAQTSENTDVSNQPDPNGAVTAAANVPGGAPGGGVTTTTNQSGQTTELTNYEISNTRTTEVTAPGEVRKLSVSVAVDYLSAPAANAGEAPTYEARSAEDMQRIENLVRAAVGYDAARGDQLSVVNIRFNHGAMDQGGTASNTSLFDFDKNDIMRAAEIGVLTIVALLIIFFLGRPLINFIGGPTRIVTQTITGPNGEPMLVSAPAGAAGALGDAGGTMALAGDGMMAGLPSGSAPSDMDQRIDIARIEGQVKASSVKKISEFVDRHPDESVAILRSWLHDS